MKRRSADHMPFELEPQNRCLLDKEAFPNEIL